MTAGRLGTGGAASSARSTSAGGLVVLLGGQAPVDILQQQLVHGRRAKASFENRELLEQFQEVEQLPDEDKALVKHFLDALLFKRKVQGMSAR